VRVKVKDGGREEIRTPDPLLAKQVLSQLSYTPTAGVTFILRHFRPFRNPFLRILVRTILKFPPARTGSTVQNVFLIGWVGALLEKAIE
jgi:hypothetical protein